ncbi:N-acetylmuramoyl-L-alanine amidase [Phocaeicola faecalis]
MKILIDNGHGENTPGKRSPDGMFREYSYAREIAESIVRELISRGYDAERIVRENLDVPLAERARRVNEICGKYGTRNVILVSIHCNAAGNGSQWMNARGWSAYTSKGNTKADMLASCIYKAAADKLPAGTKIRSDWSDKDPDWEENFYILTKTKCPAVLTENFFQDNKEDVEFLNSAEGKQAIIALHVEGIIKYIEE